MDDAVRIPIDLGYEVASEAAAPSSDPHTIERSDGTVVIDILAPQPCEPAPSTGDEIVVCAAAPDGQAPVAPPPTPTPREQLQATLTVKVGPVVIGPGGPDGAAGFGAKIRF